MTTAPDSPKSSATDWDNEEEVEETCLIMGDTEPLDNETVEVLTISGH